MPALLLQQDILNGTAPDIVFAAEFTDQMASLAEKGAFADLNTFLSADTVFREDLLSSVLEPFETDGKLYQLASYVTLTGMSGKTENVPDPADWTLDTFFAMLEECEQEGISLLPEETTRNTMDDYLLYYNLPSFVDYENGTCSFDSELFLFTIEYLKSLPTPDPIDASNIVASIPDIFKSYREDRILLDASASLSGTKSLILYQQRFSSKDITFLGVPTPEGGMPVLSASKTCSITADSAVKEGAWEVIRYMIRKETVRTITNDFPVSRTRLHAQVKEEMKNYYIKYGLIL